MSFPVNTDIAFTASVKAIQETLGSRGQNEVMSRNRGFQTRITPDFRKFLSAQRSFFLATASADGQPYVQHRGGAPGFIEIVDDTTIALPDYPGNRQYISLGNLSENDKVSLFFIDYGAKTRIKLWGRGRVDDLEDAEKRRLVISITAWDINCPKLLPELYTAETVARAQEKLLARIAELEEELARRDT